MLLRYERQLKQSEGARMAAEQAARSATAAADEARQLLASSGRQAKQRSAHLAVEAEAVQQVRLAWPAAAALGVCDVDQQQPAAGRMMPAPGAADTPFVAACAQKKTCRKASHHRLQHAALHLPAACV